MLNPSPQAPAILQLPEAPADLAARLADGGAVAWEEDLEILTYDAADPSPYPMYFDNRVYQGSSGRIYPIPFVEQVADEPRLRSWRAVHLENRYVRLVVLPELGGRIHIGYDKTTGYDFFYRNNVIKPALVGLGGPWISGGIEFNWPQHHRPATWLGVDTTIEEEADGAVTLWCGDHDPFARMSAQHGIRLRPDSSVIELRVRLHNRTALRQSFLWWANVAAAVGDDYQTFFPEDVAHVADHARRAITAFPCADRPYYGVDYSALAAERPGADRIDWYRNIPVPTSYMIVDSFDDFFGGYDHGVGAGFVHWAERRVSPGKKQWTWGNSPFGRAWDAQLTDADGPYVELMAGVYTDNQPDFTWLLPGETKVFAQYWYPIPAIGPAHQATPDAAVHVARDGAAVARFSVTSPRPGAVARLLRDGVVVAEQVVDLEPGHVATVAEAVAGTGGLTAELLDAAGLLLVRWEPKLPSDVEPAPAEAPAAPTELRSVEELYLTGVHLEQYRHPTRSPLPYYEEALRRDPGHAPTNVALAERAFRAGGYEAALALTTTALTRLTRLNAQPLNAEAYYLHGLILLRLGRTTDAARAFGKAGWDAAWAAPAGFELASLQARLGHNRAALRVLDTLDGVVGHDTRRIALRAVLLRRVGRAGDADALVAEALATDPLSAELRVLAGVLPGEAGTLLDVAVFLRDCGETDDALRLLGLVEAAPPAPAGTFGPVAGYVAAELLETLGRPVDAQARRAAAAGGDLTWVFPDGLDAHDALTAAVARNAGDPVAHHLLGMLLYQAGRRREALDHWEAALAAGWEHPVLLRNAALAQFNVAGDDAAARSRYDRAVAVAPRDARLRYERDQLAVRLGDTEADRYARLVDVEDVVLTRDDLTISFIGLLLTQGRADRAFQILTTRRFHPWEGGEGKALAAWDATRAALGLEPADPPATLGEARPVYVPPVARHDDGSTDYFATSLPELLLFTR